MSQTQQQVLRSRNLGLMIVDLIAKKYAIHTNGCGIVMHKCNAQLIREVVNTYQLQKFVTIYSDLDTRYFSEGEVTGASSDVLHGTNPKYLTSVKYDGYIEIYFSSTYAPNYDAYAPYMNNNGL